MMNDQLSIYQHPVRLLQDLIRFDTTNPPGNEAACIAYVDDLLTGAGIETTLLARDPERPNLVARLPGRGDAPPLLLQGHVDVVTTENQDWRYPPFEGRLVDGYVWGRGALDMKGGLAMMLAALLRARAEGRSLPGDVVLAVLSDEETGGALGARFLVEEHPHLFEGVRYALGEVGGFSLHLGGRRFYPIQVAEKIMSAWQTTLRGPGGHGSQPLRGGAMARLGRILTRLEEQPLPLHVTPVVRQMIETMAPAVPGPTRTLLNQLLDPATADGAIHELGPVGGFFESMLRNVVNPTIVRGGHKINVIPSEIRLQLDTRLLPGYTADDMMAEVRQVVGEDLEYESVMYDPHPVEIDMGLFETLAGVLRQADPEGVPLPFLMPAGTDGRLFARLGIQPYGFLPMKLPPEINLLQAIHAADERIPVEALDFGTEAIYQVLQRIGG
ncbi:MAG: M20/M25/M40 family metallo-hydrolase [Anaerolineae bacterium]